MLGLGAVVRLLRWLAGATPPPPPPSPRRLIAYELTSSLKDIVDAGDRIPDPADVVRCVSPFLDAAGSASSATSTPTTSASSAGDIDDRATDFIESFRRNISLELRYCSPGSDGPALSPVSPDTYFNLRSLDRMFSAASPEFGGGGGFVVLPARPGQSSIKHPAERPSVVIYKPTPTAR